MSDSSVNNSDSPDSAKPEPFRFLYFSRLASGFALDEGSGARIGRIRDFLVQAVTPYPVVCGMEIETPSGVRQVPFSAVRDMADATAYLAAEAPGAVPVFDYTIRRNLFRKLAVEVSATAVVRMWDIHFVYSEGKMVLAHAETGIRGILRAVGLEKPIMASLGRLLPGGLLKERFATFRHLQVIRPLAGGTFHVPKRILEMHPADLARILKQLPGRLRRSVVDALAEETAALVLREAETRLQARLLADCPAERREAVRKLMAAARETPPL